MLSEQIVPTTSCSRHIHWHLEYRYLTSGCLQFSLYHLLAYMNHHLTSLDLQQPTFSSHFSAGCQVQYDMWYGIPGSPDTFSLTGKDSVSWFACRRGRRLLINNPDKLSSDSVQSRVAYFGSAIPRRCLSCEDLGPSGPVTSDQSTSEV
jgi:hypothetical protein